LDLAKERAATLGLRGAAFPWRTIRGQECSGYWPAGTAAFHINADIAAAVARYRSVTGDETLETEVGLEILVETARLWISLGHHDLDGVWHIAGVTGPDEYTAIVNDNVFTNLAAAHNLRSAAEAAERHPRRARDLGITLEEVAAWRDAADTVNIPYDPTCACINKALGSPGCHPGTSRRPATSTRCCYTRRTSICTAAR
jgi:alpha,alpha-trehalose phosphorylase